MEGCAVICRLQAIAGSPELYPELIRLGGLPHILALLSHDNSDIAASAIQLLRELTDADAIEDSVSHSLSDSQAFALQHHIAAILLMPQSNSRLKRRLANML